MSPLIIVPETLADAWALYVAYVKDAYLDKSYDIIRLTKTALLIYTLPGYGLPAESTKVDALQFMNQVDLKSFPDALNVQQTVFEFLGKRKYIQRANRYRLKMMLDWCSKQSWWRLATKAEPGFYSPRRRNRLGNAHDVKLITNKKYIRYSLKILKPDKLPGISAQEAQHMKEQLARINQELADLYRFQTGIQVRKRQDAPIEKSTANTHQIVIAQLGG